MYKVNLCTKVKLEFKRKEKIRSKMGCAPSYFAVWLDEKRVAAQNKRTLIDHNALELAKTNTTGIIDMLDKSIEEFDVIMIEQKQVAKDVRERGDMDKMKSIFNKWRLARVNRKMAFALKDTLSTNMSKIEARYMAVSVLKYSAEMNNIMSTKVKTANIEEMMETVMEKVNDGIDIDALIKEHTNDLTMKYNQETEGEENNDLFESDLYKEFWMEDIPAVPKADPTGPMIYARGKNKESNKLQAVQSVQTANRSPLTAAGLD